MIYNNFYYGNGRSKYDQSSFDSMVNVDVHSVPGEARCQLALASESTTPNENCVQDTDTAGNTFFASTESGKIWKRTSAGVYSLVHTNTIGANCSIKFFNGNLYYSSETKLGKITTANASSQSSWSSQNDSFGSFTGELATRPMYIMNLSLFIGDGPRIAAVDFAGTFSANVLDFYEDYTVQTMTGAGTDLLIGTAVSVYKNIAKVFLWDTYSSSWTVEDDVPEQRVNCFIPTDNIIFASCGSDGWIYYWTGERMERFKQVRNADTSGTTHHHSTIYRGRALFSNGTKIFSIHRTDKDLPWAIVQEYTATAGSIVSMGTSYNNLLVSTGDNIDKIGTSYATAVIDTPESYSDKQKVIVKYDSIGSGGTISISTSTNSGAFTAQTAIIDSIKNEVSFDGGLGKTNHKQARVTMTPSGANNIGIKSIEL